MELNDTQKEHFSAMEGTFRTSGWTLLTQGWTTELESLADTMFYNAKSMEDINEARVRHGLLNELINLPETIARQRADIEDDEDTREYV